MRIRVGGILAAAATVLSLMAAPALASWAGTDPGSNLPMGNLPSDCWSDPTGAVCTDAAVALLNQARASLGQPAYVLPADFGSLSPAQQLLILTNSDRTLYGLSPIPGLTDALNQDAAQGARTDNDPWPTGSSWMAYTSNWAGGYANAVLAYEGWMYDDGPGSGNLDCTATNSSGCWGHRHDVLWRFDASGPVAMGAAAGTDSSGMSGFAMVLVEGTSGYQPTYSYTWAQAVADGAGGSTGSVGSGSGSGSGAGSGSGSGSGSTGSGSTGSGSGSGSTGAGSGSGSTGSGSTGSGSTGTGSGSTGSGSTGSGSTGSGTGSGSTGTGSGSTGSGSGSGSTGAGSGDPGSGTGSPGSTGDTGSGSESMGSGSGHQPGARSAHLMIHFSHLQVHAHRVFFRVDAPRGLTARCVLRHWRRGRWHTDRSKRCRTTVTFRHLPRGRYRVRIISVEGTVVRRVMVP